MDISVHNNPIVICQAGDKKSKVPTNCATKSAAMVILIIIIIQETPPFLSSHLRRPKKREVCYTKDQIL